MGACVNLNLNYQFVLSREVRSVVENFHLYNDKYFISYLESKICISNEGSEKTKDYSKLNEPINMVTFNLIQFADTILHYAVFHNKQELCKYLLTHGADFKIKNKRKKSPYDIAKERKMDDILILFEEKK